MAKDPKKIVLKEIQKEQYNLLRWPPDMQQAKRHLLCNKPGIEKDQQQPLCPCCSKKQRHEIFNINRDIAKDFQNLGGGVPGYFSILKYLLVALVIEIVIKVAYHIYLLYAMCPLLPASPEHGGCVTFLNFFKICDSQIFFNGLINIGQEVQAYVFEGLSLLSYILLIIATIGIKVLIQNINQQKTSLDQKLYSRFALIFKNVPRYYQLKDLQKDLKSTDSDMRIQIVQMFFLHSSCRYEFLYKKLFDLNFQIDWLQSKQTDKHQMVKKYEQYIKLYDQTQTLAEDLIHQTKKVIIMFNTTEQRQFIHRKYRLNFCQKLNFYFKKFFAMNVSDLPYFSQALAQPQEIFWTFIGESSTPKTRVRILTTFIIIIFTLVSFFILAYPMLKIYQQIALQPALGTALGIILMIILVLLNIFGTQLIVYIIPYRKPSSKLNASYFLILSLIVLFFFFYIIAPIAFYAFFSFIPFNYKLAILFMNTIVYLVISLVFSLVDLPYQMTKGHRQKLLKNPQQANRYCQKRLHQEINHIPFPVQLRLVNALSIWLFNAYFLFELPYLPILFLVFLFLVYWIDKYILYKHYSIRDYLSLEMELKTQQYFFYFFLIVISLGYLVSTCWDWQRYVVCGVFVLAIVANVLISRSYKQKRNNVLKNKEDITSAVKKSFAKKSYSFRHQVAMKDLKNSFISTPKEHFSEKKSLKKSLLSPSHDIFKNQIKSQVLQQALQFGYKSIYDTYLSQFNSDQVNEILQKKYMKIRKTGSLRSIKEKKRRNSQLMKMESGLNENLIDHSEPTYTPIIKINGSLKIYNIPEQKNEGFQEQSKNSQPNTKQKAKKEEVYKGQEQSSLQQMKIAALKENDIPVQQQNQTILQCIQANSNTKIDKEAKAEPSG